MSTRPLAWDNDTNTVQWFVLKTVMLVALFNFCLQPLHAFAADGPEDFSSLLKDVKQPDEINSPDEMNSDEEAVPDKQEGEMEQPAEMEQSSEAIDVLETVSEPVMGFIGFVVDVVGAIFGDEAIDHLDKDQIRLIALQFEEQLWPQLKSELEFVRLFCGDLTPDQRQIIRTAAEEAVKQASVKIVSQLMLEEEGKPVSDEFVDPGTKIQEAIIEAMKNVVSDRQVATLIEETGKRAADRKRAIILSVICQLDKHLFLSEDQRATIQQKIESEWKPDWRKWQYTIKNDYIPEMPDQCVVPFLSTDQETVWRGLQKWDFSWDSVAGDFETRPDEEDWWGLEKDHEILLKNMGEDDALRARNMPGELFEAGELVEEVGEQ